MKRYGVQVGFCALFWSGNFVPVASSKMQPVELTFFRWTFVCIMLLPALPTLRVRRLLALIRAHFITSLLALLGVTLFVHLMPLFGAILACLFLGETLQHYRVIGALLIGAGIYTSLFLPKRGV